MKTNMTLRTCLAAVLALSKSGGGQLRFRVVRSRSGNNRRCGTFSTQAADRSFTAPFDGEVLSGNLPVVLFWLSHH